MDEFTSSVLSETEDSWTQRFAEESDTYLPPRLRFFDGTTRSGCGDARETDGTFYCSPDRRLYVDKDFHEGLVERGAPAGSFTHAYVLVHSVGHHVQNLLGIQAQAQREAAGLDERGRWYLRDEQAQASGAFDSAIPGAKGAEVRNEKLADFIARNYLAEPDGRWFFQNGPQRVYVQLELAPLVLRVWPASGMTGPRLETHTGRPAQLVSPQSVWISEEGHVLIETDQGPAVVHPQDMLPVADAIEQGLWQPQALDVADWPARFGFQRHPQP